MGVVGGGEGGEGVAAASGAGLRLLPSDKQQPTTSCGGLSPNQQLCTCLVVVVVVVVVVAINSGAAQAGVICVSAVHELGRMGSITRSCVSSIPVSTKCARTQPCGPCRRCAAAAAAAAAAACH